MTSVKRNELVWHYTNATGLLGMIQGKQLWATHFQFMNDFLEGSVLAEPLRKFINSDEDLGVSGRSLLIDLVGKYEGNYQHYLTRVPEGNRFLLCGSTEGDELTLWRNYAQESVSYSVGFDPSVPLGVIPPSDNLGRLPASTVDAWTEVDYRTPNADLPEEYANALRDAANQEDMGDRIWDISNVLQRIFSVVKSAAFKDEREIRVVSLIDNQKLWRFRVGRFGITPYIALGSSRRWGEISSGEDLLPIRAIRLSTNATSADRLALNALLESNGFEGGAETEDVIDDNGNHITVLSREYGPPVEILQANNSLRL